MIFEKSSINNNMLQYRLLAKPTAR